VHYQIRVKGVLDDAWSGWFDGLRVRSDGGGETIIAGSVTDQAALHGLLAKIEGSCEGWCEVRGQGSHLRPGATGLPSRSAAWRDQDVKPAVGGAWSVGCGGRRGELVRRALAGSTHQRSGSIVGAVC
jgi:hypothetical protein